MLSYLLYSCVILAYFNLSYIMANIMSHLSPHICFFSSYYKISKTFFLLSMYVKTEHVKTQEGCSLRWIPREQISELGSIVSTPVS